MPLKSALGRKQTLSRAPRTAAVDDDLKLLGGSPSGPSQRGEPSDVLDTRVSIDVERERQVARKDTLFDFPRPIARMGRDERVAAHPIV